jgi:hypothetical protein
MRLVLISLVTLFVFTITNAQKDAVQSKIEKVTVFLQGAQVERAAKQALAPGKYNLTFPGISSRIDKQSIQLKAEGKLTILSVNYQVNFLREQQVQDEIKDILAAKDQLMDKIGMEKNMQNVYKQEEQMILKNQNIKGDNATLKAAELREAVDFQRQRLTEVYQKLLENDHNLKRFDADLQKINRQLEELNQKKDLSTSDIIVSVDVKEVTNAVFHLSYLVKQAAWFPTYDLRVQDITKPLTLQMKANINQQSGEDWKDVKFFLSTGDPSENGTKPALLPWYLRYLYSFTPTPIIIRGTSSLYGAQAPNRISGIIRDDKGVPIAGATIVAKGTSSGTVTDASGHFSILMPSGTSTIAISSVGYQSQEVNCASGSADITMTPSTQALQEVVVTGYGLSSAFDFDDSERKYKSRKEPTDINTTTIYRPTTTVFEVEDPYSVPNDGKLYTVDINTYTINASYEYYAAPKFDEDAYLTAKIINWQELNLQPGQANLFFEGTYLGNSSLDLASAGDTLKLSLGKDKGVVIKRVLVKEFSQKKLLGNNKNDSRQYEITVRNNKQQAINIIVQDQFPISTNKDIEVEKLSYAGAKLDDDTKAVTWNLNIDTKKETKLQLGFSVKYPKDKTLQLQ